MIRNFIKIAFRNLGKHPFISFINLFGLTVGLTCCLLITIYIVNELSYDKYHSKANRIYRITREFRTPDGNVALHLGTISPPFAPLLRNDFPQIEKLTRLLPLDNPVVMRYGEKMFAETEVYFADEFVPEVFDLQMIKGNAKQALSNPFHIMLSEAMAEKYFGNEDPMNKEIRFDNQQNAKVAGVYKAFPANSHIHPSIMISFNTLKDSAIYGEENLRTNWGNNSFLNYILLPQNFKPEQLLQLFPAFVDKHMSREYTMPGFKPSQLTSLHLQKLTDIHLRSHLDYEAEENGDIKRVYIFSAIALFILLIACINYMNLSTARSTLRAREIGIRKVVGAQRKEIISQFLSESVLLVAIALLLALTCTILALPWLNKVSGQVLSAGSVINWKHLPLLLAVPLVVGILAGIYPAMFMSAFQPVKVLKGLLKSTGGISFRKVLVTIQFAISIVLIISTVTVFKQLRYMQTQDLGYDRSHVVTLPFYSVINDRFDAFRSDLQRNPAVLSITRSSRIPTGRLLDNMGASTMAGDSMRPSNVDVKYVMADHDFLPTYNIKIVKGRNFSREFGTDTASFVLNEAAVKALGWKSTEDAVGKPFLYGGINGRVIGIMQDFHFESMHQKILPLVLILPAPNQAFYSNISVKIAGNNLKAALGHLEETWKKYLPETPYQYSFLDENFNRLYQTEMRQGNIFSIFSCIAIFIACLGLLGLSAFSISQRIKEIGIRKVLGASTQNIVTLISRDFLKLVALAAVLAFPLAWYFMHSWLQDFAYRINMPWWVFLAAGILAAIIALVTISFQAIKAAWMNPVKNLRTE
jgi:putative ABC transport system permease protein